jgi:high affinity Mn2+ porin
LIGGNSTLVSRSAGLESYSENILTFSALRGHIGYAPGNWLFYATGGFAWAYDQAQPRQLSTGITTRYTQLSAAPFKDFWR